MDNADEKISRLEIIDHRPCNKCDGKGVIVAENYSISGHICDACNGRGSRGRDVIFWDNKTELQLSYQDDGKTLKIFLGDRKVELPEEEASMPKTLYTPHQMQEIIKTILGEKNNESNR